MVLTKSEISDIYRKRAKNYDLSANLYYLLGFREAKYRKLAVRSLNLQPGDSVVEIGCGTSLNFGYLLKVIGERGKLTGVDLSDAMLNQATKRVRRNNWTNVELICTDAATFSFPKDVSGIISTFALTLIPEYETIVSRASDVLGANHRLVILDLKKPDHWPMWVVKLGVLLIGKPFGVSLDLADRKPWLAMKKYFSNVTVNEIFGGFAYIAVGENEP
jgi:demethylmenaquinone methyltransferase/2-methoxy-6-polyprenyl-1,4-benzoquinol methylase